jgi:hypothetical protein
MKKTTILFVILIPALVGCKYMDPVGDFLFKPIVKTETTHTNAPVILPDIVLNPDGTTTTNQIATTQPVSIVRTNIVGYTLKPSIEKTIHLAGDVAPFPWASLVANALICTLGGLAALRGQQWKKATNAAVNSADKWREVVKSLDPDEDKKIKKSVVKDQRANGTYKLISHAVKTSLK